MTDRRTRTFFWLGVFVLPIFWSWFTLTSAHTNKERFAAMSWMLIFCALVVIKLPELMEGIPFIMICLPAIIGWVGIALWAWLFYRMGFFQLTIIQAIVLVLILVPASRMFPHMFTGFIGKPFSFAWLIWPAIPTALHILLDPLVARLMAT